VQLFYVCSPGNPTGKVLSLDDWKTLFALSDKYGFIIASDECYSEIYFDEANPPLGGLQAAKLLGRSNERLVMFSSLSKRSNVPGMRSGFVAGDAAILKKFLLYRTYHGCAMAPPVQTGLQRRCLERRGACARQPQPVPREVRRLSRPDRRSARHPHARRQLLPVGQDADPDTEFARGLLEHYNVVVLPGSFLAREVNGVNPGANFVRIALVASLDECLEAARRIRQFAQQL
jgi:N-succinyldiaminopimelate aminotransferase